MNEKIDQPVTEEGWAKTLFVKAKSEDVQFSNIKASSPFADNLVIAVSYGFGATFYGDISQLMDWNCGFELDFASSIIKNAICDNGMRTYNWDDYILIFSKVAQSKGVYGKPKIFWIGNNRMPSEEP